MLPFSGSYFSMEGGQRAQGVATPFLLLRNFYAGRCVSGPNGVRDLEVSGTPSPGDARTSPVDLDAWYFGTKLGLHVLDLQIPQGDLVDLVTARAQGSPAARP
jgi:hypothetical protein